MTFREVVKGRVQFISRKPDVFCATVLEFERHRYNRYYRYFKFDFYVVEVHRM